MSTANSPGSTASGNFFEGMNFKKTMYLIMGLILVIASVMSGISLMIWSWRTDPGDVQRTEQLRLQLEIAKATGAYPPGYTRATAIPARPFFREGNTSAGTASVSSVVVSPEALPCGTKEERLDSFQRGAVRDIPEGQTLSAPLGCVKVKFSGDVKSITGTVYSIQTVSGSCNLSSCPVSYCGNGVPGNSMSSSTEECVRFINKNKGRTLWLYAPSNLQIM